MKTMSRLILVLVAINLTVFAYSQKVVQWKYSSKKIADKTYEVHISASINDGWHIYSQFTPMDGPSLPTSFQFNKNPLITLAGNVKEMGTLVTKHEELFDVNLKYYRNKVDFVQVVKLKNNIKTNVTGTLEFMACTDERCLLPESITFSVPVGDQ
jgi:thiol:disulfide interchange protein DsbD